MFAMPATLPGSVEPPGFWAPVGGTHAGAEKAELTLWMEERGDEIAGWVEYDRGLFEPATVRRMIGHYKHLLEAACNGAGECISRLPMLGEAERRGLVEGWNRTEREYPRACIHELFEEQASRTPDAIAFVYKPNGLVTAS